MYTTNGLEVQDLDINDDIVSTRTIDRKEHYGDDVYLGYYDPGEGKKGYHYRYKREITHISEQRVVHATLMFDLPCADE